MKEWTGEILAVTKNANGGLDAALQWTDGVNTESRRVDGLLNTSAVIATLEKILASKNRDEALKAEIDATDTAILIGPLADVKDALKPEVIPPTQDEAARLAFQDALRAYRIELAADALGLPPSELGLAKLLQGVQNTYRPEYASLLLEGTVLRP